MSRSKAFDIKSYWSIIIIIVVVTSSNIFVDGIKHHFIKEYIKVFCNKVTIEAFFNYFPMLRCKLQKLAWQSGPYFLPIS